MEAFVLFSCLSIINFSLKFSHPLILGMGLLFILVGVSMFVIFYGSFYSFCLFMVMVGGVLVVFSYTISLIPFYSGETKYGSDEKPKLFSVTTLILSVVSFGLIMILFVMDKDWMEFGAFSEILYFSESWSIGIIWMSLLLLLIMVFSVSVAGKYSGALLK